MKGKGRWYIGNHEELDEQNWRIQHPAAFYLKSNRVEQDLRAINGGSSTIWMFVMSHFKRTSSAKRWQLGYCCDTARESLCKINRVCILIITKTTSVTRPMRPCIARYRRAFDCYQISRLEVVYNKPASATLHVHIEILDPGVNAIDVFLPVTRIAVGFHVVS